LVVVSLWACSGKRNAATSPGESIVRAGLVEAETLYRRGCYVTLKRAFEIYQELYAYPSLREQTALPFLKTCLLLAARGKDVHVSARGMTLIDTAEAIIEANRGLERYRPWMHIASYIVVPPGTDLLQDSEVDQRKAMEKYGAEMDSMKKLLTARDALKAEALTDEFRTSLYAAWLCSPSLFQEYRQDPAIFSSAFPTSLLIKYQTAVCGLFADRKALEEIAAAEPEFYEAWFHLGELSIGEGRILSAEKELLRAGEGIPESPRILILLAGVYFATEEYEKGLEYFDRALALSPEDRDALLGKAVCLASLKRYDESIGALDRIIALGSWLIGESHYWLAWNKHELGRNSEAQADIDQAKSRLPTNSEVFSLSGTVAFETGALERAEKDFKESLQYNASNTESLFGLGAVKAKTNRWAESTDFFEKAAQVVDRTLAGVRDKIEELRASDLSAERKNRLIQRNELKRQSLLYSRATAYYGAASGRFNAGDAAGAEKLAVKAAEHPSYKEKAADLLKTIGNDRTIGSDDRGRTKISS